MNVKSALPTAAWPPFLRVHAEIVAAIEHGLAAAGLPSLAWYDVLWALAQAPGRALRMSALADAMVLSRSHLSHLVARLEAEKLVIRRKSADDGRGAEAVLTDKGAGLRSAMWPTYRDAIEQHFARHLRPGDAHALEAILRRLLASRRAAGGDGTTKFGAKGVPAPDNA